MSEQNIVTEVIQEEMEGEMIVPDEPEVAIYEESVEENQQADNSEQTAVNTIRPKPITITTPHLQKDGKPVYKLLNLNGGVKLVQLNLKTESDVQGNPVYISQPQQPIQIKNGPIAPVTVPSSQACDVEPSEYRLWSANATKLLIELYKKYCKKVGTGEIKTWKKCWETIADDINKLVPEVNISGCHAENRWRVLARNYRKYLSKGKFKKFFEYAKEFDEINSMKDHPYTPYKSKTEVTEPKNQVMLIANKPGTNIMQAKILPIKPTPQIEIVNKAPLIVERNASIKREQTVIQRDNKVVRKKFSKVNVFVNMRKDRLRYYKQRIAIEKARLQLEKEKVVAMKVKNKLMKERNDILSNFNKSTVLYDICSN